MSIEALTLLTADGLTLEAQRCPPPDGIALRAAAVLCHPHPAFGGTMQSLVISPLFEALPLMGVDVLRFNFRGVGRSQGTFDDGDGEQFDAEAAVLEHRAKFAADIPLVMIGFSFGADIALSCTLSAIDAHCAIASPLRFGKPESLELDGRPKQIVLAAHDEFRDPAWVAERMASWSNLKVDSVAGANHFFVARTEPLIAIVAAFIDRVVADTA